MTPKSIYCFFLWYNLQLWLSRPPQPRLRCVPQFQKVHRSCSWLSLLNLLPAEASELWGCRVESSPFKLFLHTGHVSCCNRKISVLVNSLTWEARGYWTLRNHKSQHIKNYNLAARKAKEHVLPHSTHGASPNVRRVPKQNFRQIWILSQQLNHQRRPSNTAQQKQRIELRHDFLYGLKQVIATFFHSRDRGSGGMA